MPDFVYSILFWWNGYSSAKIEYCNSSIYYCTSCDDMRNLVCRDVCVVLVAIMFFTVEFTLGARCVGVGPSHEATSPRLSVCTSRFALSGVIISASCLSTLVEFTVWLFKL